MSSPESWDITAKEPGLSWPEMRRDVFAILLMAVDGHDVPDAVTEADRLIAELDKRTDDARTL